MIGHAGAVGTPEELRMPLPDMTRTAADALDERVRITEVRCAQCVHTFFEHEGDGDGPYPCEADGCDCDDAVIPGWPDREGMLAR